MNKRLMLQEWYVVMSYFHKCTNHIDNCLLCYRGVCYHEDSTNLCDTDVQGADPNRNSIIQKFAGILLDAGIPWLYWQVLPNADPHVRTQMLGFQS